jgi:hypothetical protein
MANHISTQNESKLKIAKQSYKGVKFMKSCSKLQKLPSYIYAYRLVGQLTNYLKILD